MKNFKKECVVVGAGLTGSVISRYLTDKGYKVTIWERRNHIGGNMYDYVDENRICVHQYGPHIFHTNNDDLAAYMKKYAEWIDFPISCQVNMLGKTTPSPFNFQTIDDYYEPEVAKKLKKALLNAYPGRNKVTIVEMLESENPIVKQYADFLFVHDYSLYTAKQWGVSPAEIDPSVLKRVPVLLSYKDGYFDDKWQMVPEDGYTNWFSGILNHENISVELGIEALERISIKDKAIWIDGRIFEGLLIYTGAIDELFKLEYGPLPYRSLRFEWKTEPVQHYQGAALVAYPEAPDYTRITEYSHFPQKEAANRTTLAYEYPVIYQEGCSIEPYYPILTEESKQRHNKYRRLAEEIKGLVCCGRLADFKYYNMDEALENALNICSKLNEYIMNAVCLK